MASTKNVHLAGIKALHIADLTDAGTLKADTANAYKVKNPAADTFVVNPTAPAYNEKFRENQSYPAIANKDPKTGRIESLAWEVLDWDDDTMELYLGGASTTDDVWKASQDSYSTDKAVRVDFIGGWSLFIPQMKIAASPGGDASANGKLTIQVMGKVVSNGTDAPVQRIATPVAV